MAEQTVDLWVFVLVCETSLLRAPTWKAETPDNGPECLVASYEMRPDVQVWIPLNRLPVSLTIEDDGHDVVVTLAPKSAPELLELLNQLARGER